MTNKKYPVEQSKPQGFTVVAASLLVFIIAVLGIGGWYIWQKSHAEDRKSQTVKNKSIEDSPKPIANGEPNPANVENDSLLVIKEWGVTVTLPESLRGDITYFVNTRAEKDFGGPVLIDFVSKRFSAGNLKCAVIEGDIPRSLVSIDRKELGATKPTDYFPEPFKVIEGQAYFSGGTPCQEAIDREGSIQDKKLLANLTAAIQNTLQN